MRFVKAVTALLVLAPGMAFAQPKGDGETDKAVRCLVVYMKMSSSPDVKVQQSGGTGTIYWLGRLDGHDPKLDLESRVVAQAKSMDDAALQVEGTRCGAEMVARGQFLAAMGKDIAAKGQ